MEAWLIAIVALGALLIVGDRRDPRPPAGRRAGAGGGRRHPAPTRSSRSPQLRERATRLEDEATAAAADRAALIEALRLGVIGVDERLRIVTANAAAHGLMQRAPGSLVGRSLIEMFLDLQVEAIARAAFADGRATGEVALAGADGPRIVVHAHRAPGGGIWLILEDVSELRRLQRIRTEFIDNLSHELRTPLTTVSLLAETLARDAAAAGKGVPPRMRDRIASIEVETGHLVQMVNELLDLSRIESGRALGAMDPLDLGEVAQDATERLRLFAERQGVTLAVVIPEPVPTVRGDEARLGQVLVNLLHNAVKFSPDGGAVTVTGPRASRRTWSCRSPTMASASRGRPRRASSSASTRSIGRASAARAAGPAWAWPSPATSSSSTAAGSGSNRPRAPAARSRSRLPIARHRPS